MCRRVSVSQVFDPAKQRGNRLGIAEAGQRLHRGLADREMRIVEGLEQRVDLGGCAPGFERSRGSLATSDV